MSAEEEAGDDKPNVLVVEDDTTVLGFIVRTLKRGGISCLTAESAEEALQVSSASERDIDLLILDIMLPDSWGTRLMQDVRAQHPDVKVILTSGYTSNDPVLAAGVEARDPDIPFLKKPFTPEELLETVRSMLGQDPETSTNDD